MLRCVTCIKHVAAGRERSTKVGLSKAYQLGIVSRLFCWALITNLLKKAPNGKGIERNVEIDVHPSLRWRNLESSK